MNAIRSCVKKAVTTVAFSFLLAGLSGCAPVLGLAAVGVGASLVAIDHSTHAAPYTSTASVQSAESR
jgi:hypothetical protein